MQKIIRQYILQVIVVLSFGATTSAYADLIVGANSATETITDIVLAPWGTESFAISTTNSQANCTATNGWVIFIKSNQSSDAAYDRAYSMALSAMSANQPVFVDSSNGADCTAAYLMGVGVL